ncbi:NUDIX domain-containing protein [Zhouia spongiae]|uniref:NUDIX domain-containing protein n=1 Tax=Zhouia spongiae TaxID=2202721 RepID=A0ABY3YMV6_9FLAO|nr:NUDIX domain-containing protein [Zhouia spongiae]UNY98983.1 NUDIX domain-containing protein [Zhouia spongiae]
MYEVFVNDHPIYLTNSVKKEMNDKLFLLDTFDIEYVVNQLNNEDVARVFLYHPDKENLLKKFKKRVPVVVAGGGLVVNPKGEKLMIYRNGKWDIPKGKLDAGESIEEAAIREVEEETAVKGLELDKFLCKTYHIFKRNGDFKLKETYWYAMNTDFSGKLKPQRAEGIQKAEWQHDEKILQSLQNSYPNIRLVIEAYNKLPHKTIHRVS